MDSCCLDMRGVHEVDFKWHKVRLSGSNAEKGFGFISPDGGGEDLFVHQSEIQMEGFRDLPEGQRVEFEATQGQKGHAGQPAFARSEFASLRCSSVSITGRGTPAGDGAISGLTELGPGQAELGSSGPSRISSK